ncbi:MAG: hypothetical protein AAFO91_20085, partial [Bacteroidota bacterium]
MNILTTKTAHMSKIILRCTGQKPKLLSVILLSVIALGLLGCNPYKINSLSMTGEMVAGQDQAEATRSTVPIPTAEAHRLIVPLRDVLTEELIN